MKLNLATLLLALIAVVVLGVSVVRHPAILTWTPGHIAGMAIAIPAFVLLVIARLQLGRAFSVRAKASNLVTTGLYARIRNPIYVFGALIATGIIIFVGRPWWLLIFAILIPMQWVRVRQEERVLEAKFGQEYRDYKQTTWF